jgi:hypothetical protein
MSSSSCGWLGLLINLPPPPCNSDKANHPPPPPTNTHIHTHPHTHTHTHLQDAPAVVQQLLQLMLLDNPTCRQPFHSSKGKFNFAHLTCRMILLMSSSSCSWLGLWKT